ncbi:MAG: sigma-70 family RNA polymerase sigma factor [Flavobacteriales bacterium]|nr:sigma-70 family RNA polymerase sigma factor [Flavobacteriales bacterium]
MTEKQMIIALLKNDLALKRKLFEEQFAVLSGIALRFSKNEMQAKELLIECFDKCIERFVNQKSQNTLPFNEFILPTFIEEAIQFIKNIRNEYFVASTVNVRQESEDSNYSLFENNEIIDFNALDKNVALKAIQHLVPSQRLIYNLYVIEGYTFEKISNILDTSEQTLKSNFEKARFNFQKNIERIMNESKYEQAF